MKMADVLLQPSKTEGFGMPVLEAQLLGVPVITTAFAAMSDYTLYGTAVPSLQPHYYPMGWTATPSLAGVADALQGIYHGRVEGSRAAAQAYIAEHMSLERVASRFQDAVLSSRRLKPRHKRISHEAARSAAPSAAQQATGARHPIAKIKRPWALLIAKETSDTVDEDAIWHAIKARAATRAAAEAVQHSTTPDSTDGVPSDEAADTVSISSSVSASGEVAAAAPGGAMGSVEARNAPTSLAAADATLFVSVDLVSQRPMQPTRRSPLLVRTAWLRAVLEASGGRASYVGRSLDELAAAAVRGDHGTTVVAGAVPKPPSGC